MRGWRMLLCKAKVIKLLIVTVAESEKDCSIYGTNETSNDIIAGNGRILSVHEYCRIIFI